MQNTKRLAVLIDAENISASCAAHLMASVATFGQANVRRAYGDWTTNHLVHWKATLFAHAIRPAQQFRYAAKKNTSDSALIMDAVDLIHSQTVDGICIVSSDSDYIGVAGRIREAGLAVYGFGCLQAPQAFRAACDAFVELDAAKKEGESGDGSTGLPPPRE